jgi:hypothetical protein
MPVEEGKADAYNFTPNLIMTDAVFQDAEFINAMDIQRFLEDTPYGHPSFLATFDANGQSVADALYSAGQEYGINPLVLLVKLQVESSLVFSRGGVSSFVIDRAMGCGCPDDIPECDRGMLGISRQIKCAARLFRGYMDAMEAGNSTISGWRVGHVKRTSDNIEIVPGNMATAALYTYTPWVLSGRGGNWLFWNVMRRFSRKLLTNHVNHRWIGGPCANESDCGYPDAICIPAEHAETTSEGVCTLPCSGVCPDSRQPYTKMTICIPSSDLGMDADGGLCASRCSRNRSGEQCELGLACGLAIRVNDDSEDQYAACIKQQDSDLAEEPADTDSREGGMHQPE